MRWRGARSGADGLVLGPGERLLASAPVTAAGEHDQPGVVGGTRDALYLPGRVPWEQVAGAAWDEEGSRLRVTEVAPWGEQPPVHVVGLAEAGRLLQLIRERVTASLVVQRRIEVRPDAAVRILARRAPGTVGAPLAWFVEYDATLEPGDPEVRAVVDAELARARADAGD